MADDDIGPLFELASRSPWLWPRLGHNHAVPPQVFAEYLWANVHTQYIATNLASVPFALVRLTRADGFSGTAWLEVVEVGDGSAPATHICDAVRLVVDNAFGVWQFRKIYNEHLAFSYNPLVLAYPFAVAEGCLANDAFVLGAYWDRIISALHRVDWENNGPTEAQRVSDGAADV